MLHLGILDQSPIVSGSHAVEAMKNTIELARLADERGYRRYWVSEHHDTQALAGSSPEVLMAAIAAHTRRIRVGSAGVLLPHYSPYKVAENFRVLEALYPGRIDLGIGRAPGGMPWSSQALRNGRPKEPDEMFGYALRDLAGYLADSLPEDHCFRHVSATPMVETVPEFWLLGSSDYSAARAAELGAAFSFAHFINPEGIGPGVTRRYREEFQAGPMGDRPRANACVHVLCADSDEEAERIAAPTFLRILYIEKGDLRRPYPSPEETNAYPYMDWELDRIRSYRNRMIVGGPDKVKRELTAFAEDYGIDEVIVLTMAYEFADRKRSYELLADLFPQSGDDADVL